jgi:hypothetical protein
MPLAGFENTRTELYGHAPMDSAQDAWGRPAMDTKAAHSAATNR